MKPMRTRSNGVGVLLIVKATIAACLLTAVPSHAELIGFYPFDNAQDPLKDASGKGNDLQGGIADPTYLSSAGIEGGAFSYNGGQRLVSPIDINADALPALTMGAWVKTATLISDLHKVIGQDDGGWDRVIGLDNRDDGVFRYTTFIGTGAPLRGTPAPRSTNDWTFLAVSYDQTINELNLYVDLDSITIGDALNPFTAATGFGSGLTTASIGSIRADNDSEGWIGQIDNVFFYDEVLSPDRIKAIRDQGRGAIVAALASDPNLKVSSAPNLRNLSKAPAVQTFVYEISNLGGAKALNITSAKVTGAGSARYAVTHFPATVAPGGKGNIEFTFDSQGQIGRFVAELTIESNDANHPSTLLDVTAQVGDDPDLGIINPPVLQAFQKVPATHDFSFGITNAGTLDTLRISRITVTGPDAAYFTIRNFPATLAPHGTNTLDFTFNSQGQVGDFTAAAVIESNDPSNPSFSLDISSRVNPTALLGFYSFDDANNPLKDDSNLSRTLQNGFDGGLADPTYQPTGGVTGGGFDFDGSMRLVVPLDVNPAGLPAVTMGAWVKTAILDEGLRKVLGQDDGAWDRVIGLDTRTQAAGGPLPDPTFRYVAFTGTDNLGPTQGDPPPTPTSIDEWTFLTAVYDQPNRQVTLYVDLDVSTTNDAPQAIRSAANSGTGTSTVSIGTINPGNSSEAWVGSIDNVFFLNGTLDAATIKSVRDGGKDAILKFRADPTVQVLTAAPIFGDLANANPKTAAIQIKNTGATQPLAIVSARLTGPDASNYTLDQVPSNLVAGATGTLEVTLDPKGKEGTLAAGLELITTSSSDRRTTLDLSAFVPYSTPLIAFYAFDDPTNPLKEARGKTGDLRLVQGSEPVYLAQGGEEGGAYRFDGGQRLVAPVNINPDKLPQLTMGAWVKTSSLVPGMRKVMGHDDGAWDRVIGLDTRAEALGGDLPQPTFRYVAFPGQNNFGPTQGNPPATPTSTEDWTFLAVTYDQPVNLVTLYVDLDSKTTNDPLWSVSSESDMGFSGDTATGIGSITSTANSESWIGLIDNVFFYQTILSVDDLTRIRNAGAGAIVPIVAPPTITIGRTGASLMLTWTGSLQSADSISGPWTDVPGVSPLPVTPSAAKQFYRAKR